MFTRKSRVQPKEILITNAKGLFQQHRSKPEALFDARISASASYGHACHTGLGR
jgi:hypothetical protein